MIYSVETVALVIFRRDYLSMVVRAERELSRLSDLAAEQALTDADWERAWKVSRDLARRFIALTRSIAALDQWIAAHDRWNLAA